MDAEMCVTCLCIPEKSHNLNEIALENIKILSILHELVPLFLEQRAFALPEKMCAKCLLKLLISYKFQRQCKDSLQNLHNLWLEKSSKVKDQKSSKSKTLPMDAQFENNKYKSPDESTMEPQPKIDQDLKITCNEMVIDRENVGTFEPDGNKNREINLIYKEDTGDTINVELDCKENSNDTFQKKSHSEDVEEVQPATNQCKVCSKIFKRPQGLASHMSKTHLKKHLYQCQKCNKGFNAEEPFIRHCNRHLGIKPFPCTQCDKAFETNNILIKHLLCHANKQSSSGKKSLRTGALNPAGNDNLFKCPICSKIFTHFSDHMKHIKTHKSRETNDNKICAKRLPTTKRKILQTDKKQFKSSQDKSNRLKKYPTKIKMRSVNENQEELEMPLEGFLTEFKHQNMEDTEEVLLAKEIFDVKKLNENESGAKKELREEPETISDNMKDKERNLSAKCDLCNQLFKNSQGLARHKASMHFKKHLFQCDKCDRGFSVEEYYIKHCNQHLGIKAFKCSQCEKAFETNSILNQHLISHSKLTPHLCTTCGKSFRRSDGLRQHMKRHGEERPFECSVCPKSFKCLSDKLRHMRIHDEKRHERYECNICGARLASPESLSNHHMIHTGEKPFKCRHCVKSFICAINRKTHERIHTGEKPYKCQYCWKSFCQSSDRKKHMRRMHKNEIGNTNSKQNENSERNQEQEL